MIFVNRGATSKQLYGHMFHVGEAVEVTDETLITKFNRYDFMEAQEPPTPVKRGPGRPRKYPRPEVPNGDQG